MKPDKRHKAQTTIKFKQIQRKYDDDDDHDDDNKHSTVKKGAGRISCEKKQHIQQKHIDQISFY